MKNVKTFNEFVNESMIPTIRDINKMSKDQLIKIQGILFGRSDQKKILNAIRKRLEQIDAGTNESKIKRSELKQMIKEIYKKLLKEDIDPSDVLKTLVGDGYGKDDRDIKQKLEKQYGETIPENDGLKNFIERLIKAFPPESDNPVDDLKYIVNSIRQGNKNDLKGFFNEI